LQQETGKLGGIFEKWGWKAQICILSHLPPHVNTQTAISNITGVPGCKRMKGKEKMQLYVFEEKERR
jgi:hypothetical protein